MNEMGVTLGLSQCSYTAIIVFGFQKCVKVYGQSLICSGINDSMFIVRQSHNLSLRFNGYFPGERGLAGVC